MRPELAYVLLLHFTFASGIGVGHAQSFLSPIVQSFPSFSSGECQVQEQDCLEKRERVSEDCYVRASEIDRQELRVAIERFVSL